MNKNFVFFRTTPVVDNCISEEHPCEVDFSQRFRQFSSTGNTEYQIKYWVVSDKTNNNRSTGREIGFHNRVFQISGEVIAKQKSDLFGFAPPPILVGIYVL